MISPAPHQIRPFAQLRRALCIVAAVAALGRSEAGSARSLGLALGRIEPSVELLPIGNANRSDNTELLGPPRPGWVWAAPARRMVVMQVTAYCPCPVCCGSGAIGLTASGEYIDYNRGQFVAADPALPFGTKLIVPGYADAASVEVIDRGSAIHGNRLDVFFATHAQARQWGRKSLPVLIGND